MSIVHGLEADVRPARTEGDSAQPRREVHTHAFEPHPCAPSSDRATPAGCPACGCVHAGACADRGYDPDEGMDLAGIPREDAAPAPTLVALNDAVADAVVAALRGVAAVPEEIALDIVQHTDAIRRSLAGLDALCREAIALVDEGTG